MTRRTPLKRINTMALAMAATFGSSCAFAPSSVPAGTCRAPFASLEMLSRRLKMTPRDLVSEGRGTGTGVIDTLEQSAPTESGSPLQMLCDDQKEFEMRLGKAVDTLRKDYPDILKSLPDFSIYDNDLEVIDPSGVKLQGLQNYKMTFKFMHTIVNLFYCPSQSGLTFRLIFDWARNSIRVSWNAVLVPKAIYGGARNKLHLDGISMYDIDRSTGLIYQHRVEHLLMNDTPVRPVKGIFYALTHEIIDPEGIPVLGIENGAKDMVVEFRGLDPLSNFFRPQSSLFAVSSSASTSNGQGDPLSDESTPPSPEMFDEEALERKNESRRKFGLAPLTPEEFEDLKAQVRQMEMVQREKAAAATSSSAAEMSKEKPKKSFMNKIFGEVLEDTCESNWDCQRPEVCCDFGFKKMCCSSGLKIFNGAPGQYEPALLPVPARGDSPERY